MELIDKDEELLEWPSDVSKMKCGRKKRFEKSDDVKKYITYHMKKEKKDNEKFMKVYSKDKEKCACLLYSKGYIIPYDWLDEVDDIGEENPYNKWYERRRQSLKERSTRRRKVYNELDRWHVKLDKVKIQMHRRLILNVHDLDVETREYTVSVVIRWLCRSVGVQEVYMYNGLRGRIGFRYYSGEAVIVIYIKDKGEEYEMDRKQLYRIRRVLRTEVVKRCSYDCSLHDKWIVVIDSTGQVTCPGYGICDLSDVYTGKDIIHKIKHYDPVEEFYNQFKS